MFLTENVPHVNGRGGFHPFALPTRCPDQHTTERIQYVCTFPPLSAVSSAFPLPFSPLFFLSLEVAPFAISIDRQDRYRVWAVGTNRIDGILH